MPTWPASPQDGHRPELWALGGPVGSGREKSWNAVTEPDKPLHRGPPTAWLRWASHFVNMTEVFVPGGGPIGRAALERRMRAENVLWLVWASPGCHLPSTAWPAPRPGLGMGISQSA